MKILRLVKNYFNDDLSLAWMAEKYCYSLMEYLAFHFLVLLAYGFMCIFVIAAFVTFPVWIIPYLVYKTVTEKSSKEVED